MFWNILALVRILMQIASAVVIAFIPANRHTIVTKPILEFDLIRCALCMLHRILCALEFCLI